MVQLHRRAGHKREDMRVLVAGGAGFIGSHMTRMLRETGHEAVVYDNLSHGHRDAVPEAQLVDGARIPGLAEVFSLVRKSGNGTVRFNIETKISPLDPAQTVAPDVFARALIAAIRSARMQDRATIQSFDWRTLAVVQKAAPEIPTVYLTAQQGFMDNVHAGESASPWTAPLHVSHFGGSVPKMVKAAGGAVWSPYFKEVTRESLREARALGLKVVVWTVNEEADMKRMIALGVDGIISDYPDQLLVVVAKAGRAPPAPRRI